MAKDLVPTCRTMHKGEEDPRERPQVPGQQEEICFGRQRQTPGEADIVVCAVLQSVHSSVSPIGVFSDSDFDRRHMIQSAYNCGCIESASSNLFPPVSHLDYSLQSKLEEGVKTATGVLDDLVAEAESKSDHAAHAMKDEAQRTADSVKEAMASSTEKISSASAATQSAVEHGTEEASKEADAAVGDMADLSKQRQDAAQQEKAAAEKAKEADVEL